MSTKAKSRAAELSHEQSAAMAAHLKEAADLIKEKERLDDSFKRLYADIEDRAQLWLAKAAAFGASLKS